MSSPTADEEHNGSSRIRGVVVGFDGSPAAEVAADWGADAAAAHGLPLTLLTARPDATAPVVTLGDEKSTDVIEPWLATHLQSALDRITQAHPTLEVSSIIHPESPVDGLLMASVSADMIAIGSRGLGGFEGLLVGSTAMNVTPYAECPVVVLYVPDELTIAARAEARHPDSIVVGFDGSHFAERALVFALQHAHVTGLDVVVVSVTAGPGIEPPQPVTDFAELPEDAQEDLARAAEIADDYPDVTISFLHTVGRPAGVLIHEASGAKLAVIGSRGRGGFAQLLLGSVGLQMLIHAECPVALVRELPAKSG